MKKFPHICGIDSSYRIIDDTQPFLIEMFERFIEKDFEKSPQEWEEIVSLFEGNSQKLLRIFSSLYNQRLKLSKRQIEKEDLDYTVREIEGLKRKMELWITALWNEYPQLLTHPNILHLNVHQLKHQIKNPSTLKIKDRLVKRQLRNASPEEKEYFRTVVKPILKEDRFLEIEENIITTGKKLNLTARDYNGQVILRKFYQFWDFVETFKKRKADRL
ncbi:MAG: hypothetical protein Q9M89_08870 [Persephonella sp.]|nr:hypothetical protein [Persephonella sp.]